MTTLLDLYYEGRAQRGRHHGTIWEVFAEHLGHLEQEHADPAIGLVRHRATKRLVALEITRRSGARQLAIFDSGLVSYLALDAARVVKPRNVGLFGDHQIEMF